MVCTKKSGRFWSAALGAFLIVSATTVAVWPQDSRLSEARREGKIVWYSGAALATAQRVASLFEQAYPGMQVELHRSGSERILQRIMQEAGAGIKNADVFNSSDAGHYVLLKKKGMLAKYSPAGADRFPQAFQDRDGMVYGWRAFLIVIDRK